MCIKVDTIYGGQKVSPTWLNLRSVDTYFQGQWNGGRVGNHNSQKVKSVRVPDRLNITIEQPKIKRKETTEIPTRTKLHK